jgi:parallel beta-helix repeat protein
MTFSCTTSAIRTDEITNLAKAIDNMSKVLDSSRFTRFPIFQNFFPWELMMSRGIIDIYDFAQTCYNNDSLSPNNEVKQCCLDVMNSVKKTVIAEWHRQEWDMAHGLTINYPEFSRYTDDFGVMHDNSLDHYRNCGLDFTNDTYWDEFLLERELNYKTVEKTGEGDFSCIQDAIDNARVGDVIYILNGTYHENPKITKPVTLVGESAKSTFIDGGNTGNVITIMADNAQLYNINLINSCESGSGVYLKGENCEINHCTVQNCHNGIYLDESKYGNIDDNTVLNSSGYAIYLLSSDDNAITGNICKKNKRHFSFYDSYDNFWLRNTNRFGIRSFYFIFGFVKFGGLKRPKLNINRGYTLFCIEAFN